MLLTDREYTAVPDGIDLNMYDAARWHPAAQRYEVLHRFHSFTGKRNAQNGSCRIICEAIIVPVS